MELGTNCGGNSMKFEMEVDAERMVGSVQIIEKRLQDQQDQSNALNGIQGTTSKPDDAISLVAISDKEREEEDKHEQSPGLEISVDTEDVDVQVEPRPDFLAVEGINKELERYSDLSFMKKFEYGEEEDTNKNLGQGYHQEQVCGSD